MSFMVPNSHNHWSPWSSFNNDLRQMRRMLDMTESDTQSTHTVEPSYRYEADATAGHFEIELPGVAKENVSIEVHENKLVVKGKRFKKNVMGAQGAAMTDEAPKEEAPKKDEPTPSLIYMLEARLPAGADVDAIKADHCGDGILTMTVPMKADKARRIQIGL